MMVYQLTIQYYFVIFISVQYHLHKGFWYNNIFKVVNTTLKTTKFQADEIAFNTTNKLKVRVQY